MAAATTRTWGATPPTRAARILGTLGKLVGAYLLGILASVIVTPAEFELAGTFLLPFYVAFALYGFVIWPVLALEESPELYRWWLWPFLLLPLLSAISAFFARSPRLRAWLPVGIGFPLGFVGAMGVYWAVFLSI